MLDTQLHNSDRIAYNLTPPNPQHCSPTFYLTAMATRTRPRSSGAAAKRPKRTNNNKAWACEACRYVRSVDRGRCILRPVLRLPRGLRRRACRQWLLAAPLRAAGQAWPAAARGGKRWGLGHYWADARRVGLGATAAVGPAQAPRPSVRPSQFGPVRFLKPPPPREASDEIHAMTDQPHT